MIAKWILIGWLVYSVIVVVKDVGKPRGPITNNMAVAVMILAGLQIATMMIWWH